ncbi:hypothetical protein [Dactylosporangium sp. CA-233914]|uniref:hypothetical protein n=1 Tax=Dactylosporangium sp. CA-233914 TaxID=3239934 RepID=UPI003D8DC765
MLLGSSATLEAAAGWAGRVDQSPGGRDLLVRRTATSPGAGRPGLESGFASAPVALLAFTVTNGRIAALAVYSRRWRATTSAGRWPGRVLLSGGRWGVGVVYSRR